MRHPAGIGLAVAVGAAAIAFPILISVRLAWRQSVAFEETRVTGYAGEALRRADEAGDQMGQAYRQLSNSTYRPCSQKDIDAMRGVDLGSTYLQAVGRISGDRLICTSLGTHQPIDLGPATLSTETGARNWLNVRLNLTGDRPMTVVARDGVALLMNPELSLDTATEGPDIALSLFVPSAGPAGRAIAGHGTIQPEWYRDVPKGQTRTFLDAGYVVSVARSKSGDVAAVAAAPASYVSRQVRHFAIIFIPIGVLCGLALAGAVLYIGRVQTSLRSLLRNAARRREFRVEYQPIVDLETHRWIGAEALVRWRRGGTMVPPDVFIPEAEASGVITLITECVAEIVAADLPSLLRIDPEFCVSINLSAADLRSGRTLPLLQRLLLNAGASPRNLQVEATESGLLHGPQSGNVPTGVRALGIGLAIDDFGTGYSSLARLQTLGPDVLKIDKSFVDAIGTETPTSQLVPHMIDMGRSLHLKIVAEGVEREEQAEYLRRRGVQYGQGWLFGRSMGLERFRAALAAQVIDAPAVVRVPESRS